MKVDIRRTWCYRWCQIVPIDCQHPTWGKSGEPIEFGDGKCRNRYWRIDFPDGQWVWCSTKRECRGYINHILTNGIPDNWLERWAVYEGSHFHQERLVLNYASCQGWFHSKELAEA